MKNKIGIFFVAMGYVSFVHAAHVQTAPAFYVEKIKSYNAEISKAQNTEKQAAAAVVGGAAVEQATRSIAELTQAYGNALQTLTDIKNAYTPTAKRAGANIMGKIHAAVQNMPDATNNGQIGALAGPTGWFARQDKYLADLFAKISEFNAAVLKQQDAASVRMQQDVQKSEKTLAQTLAQLSEQTKAAASSSATAESLKKTLELVSHALEQSEEQVAELAQEINELTVENEGLRELAHSVVTQEHMRSRSSSISSSGSEAESEFFAEPQQIQRPSSPLAVVGEHTLAQYEAENNQLKTENTECAQRLLKNVQAQKDLIQANSDLIAQNGVLKKTNEQLKNQMNISAPQIAQVLKNIKPTVPAQEQPAQPGGLRAQCAAEQQNVLREQIGKLQSKIKDLTTALKNIFEKAGPGAELQETRNAVATEYQDLLDKGFEEFTLPENQKPFSRMQYSTLSRSL